MRRMYVFALATAGLAAAAPLLIGACGRTRPSAAAEPSGSEAPLVVRRGPFERRALLSGEVDAVSSADLKVPRVSAGRVTLRWLENDGAFVKAGQKVAELDNATFLTQVKERALAVSQAEIDLARQQWQNGLEESERVLEVERRRAAVRRAEIDADVPPGILPKRDYLEKQLALRRARADMEKAEEALAAHRRTAAVDLRLKQIALEKTRREVQIAEQMLEALTLRAPADGTILIGDHYEGRKLQVGDDVYIGSTVARMPDLHRLRVKAWLSDVDDGRITPGMPVQVILDAFPDRTLDGQLLEIAPVAREVNDRSLRRVFQVAVGLKVDDAEMLRPGMSARVEVIARREADVVTVPRAALRLAPAPLVHLASGGEAPVTLGACNPQECVATAGVEPGTRLRRATP